jgi:hypothetical protein
MFKSRMLVVFIAPVGPGQGAVGWLPPHGGSK